MTEAIHPAIQAFRSAYLAPDQDESGVSKEEQAIIEPILAMLPSDRQYRILDQEGDGSERLLFDEEYEKYIALTMFGSSIDGTYRSWEETPNGYGEIGLYAAMEDQTSIAAVWNWCGDEGMSAISAMCIPLPDK